jgi:hypothetical protein
MLRVYDVVRVSTNPHEGSDAKGAGELVVNNNGQRATGNGQRATGCWMGHLAAVVDPGGRRPGAIDLQGPIGYVGGVMAAEKGSRKKCR